MQAAILKVWRLQSSQPLHPACPTEAAFAAYRPEGMGCRPLVPPDFQTMRDRTGPIGAPGALLNFHVRRATAGPRRATVPIPKVHYIPRAKGRADYAVGSVAAAEPFGICGAGGFQPFHVRSEGGDSLFTVESHQQLRQLISRPLERPCVPYDYKADFKEW